MTNHFSVTKLNLKITLKGKEIDPCINRINKMLSKMYFSTYMRVYTKPCPPRSSLYKWHILDFCFVNDNLLILNNGNLGPTNVHSLKVKLCWPNDLVSLKFVKLL
jgi:hypothetical protein